MELLNTPAAARGDGAMDPNIDPALQQQMPGRENSASPEPVQFVLKRISEAEYQQLRRTITVDLLPVNGPNEGPPEYEILPTMWDEYVKNLEAGVFDQETAAVVLARYISLKMELEVTSFMQSIITAVIMSAKTDCHIRI